MDDLIEVLVAGVLIIAVAVGVGLGVGYSVAKRGCYARWAGAGVEVAFDFWGECRVRPPGANWMPEQRYINVKEIK